MPIYQYKCESCGSLGEEIRSLAQLDEPFACMQCDSQCARNQCPGASVVLKHRQKEAGRREEQGSQGPTAISVQGPTELTLENNVFRNISRAVVAHPQAHLSIKKNQFHNVNIPVERRKE